MNQKFHATAFSQNSQTPPIWFMRQAGRYHSHYQELRKKHGFMELCKNPDLAAEVALGPVQDFDFDLAILFSDLLFPLESLGMGLDYDLGPPRLGFHLTAENIGQLKSVADALPELQFQKIAMQKTRNILPENKSLIGFVGGLWTLFTYAVEGSHSGHLASAKKLAPKIYDQYLSKMIPLLIENIKLQIEGGAEVVMILDTAAGELNPIDFANYVKKPIQEIAKQLSTKTAYYSKGTSLEQVLSMGDLNFLGFGVDHRIWIPRLQKEFKAQGQNPFIQGNFDQNLLFLDPSDFKNSLKTFFSRLIADPNFDRQKWVCGLGHGVLPKTPQEHVRYFIQYAREVFK